MSCEHNGPMRMNMVLEMPQPEDWRPIETAPTQAGAKVLLFDAANEDGQIFVGTRGAYPYAARDQDGWFIPHGWCAWDAPSHWMPLPDAPLNHEQR